MYRKLITLIVVLVMALLVGAISTATEVAAGERDFPPLAAMDAAGRPLTHSGIDQQGRVYAIYGYAHTPEAPCPEWWASDASKTVFYANGRVRCVYFDPTGG
jgi:hypothetical protein